MSEYKIYSVKANNCGHNFSGRFKATDMRDATNQAINHLNQWGRGWNIHVNELKNQKLAMKQWVNNQVINNQ